MKTETTPPKDAGKLWKSYPIGGAIAEQMEQRKQPVIYDFHAVKMPHEDERRALCGVKTFSLCMDDSLATNELPDCPRCRQAIARLEKRATRAES